MKNRINLFVVFASLLLSLTVLLGCSDRPDVRSSDLETEFSTIVPAADVNKSLQVVVDSKEDAFPLDSRIPIKIYNKSPHFIFSEFHSDIKLLTSSSGKWVEVKNGIIYKGTMLLSPQGTILLDFQGTTVRPLFTDDNSNASITNIPLRIVVVAEIMEGETKTGEKVAAFVDVLLKP